jgi:hypothetical protein
MWPTIVTFYVPNVASRKRLDKILNDVSAVLDGAPASISANEVEVLFLIPEQANLVQTLWVEGLEASVVDGFILPPPMMV